MSRTDKTAPHEVKVFYYKDWIEEYHDHRFGECDLPPRPRNRKDPGLEFWYGGARHDKTQCYWVASYTQFYNSGMSRCPCYMCHGSWAEYGNPKGAKRQRIEGRRYTRGGWMEEY